MNKSGEVLFDNFESETSNKLGEEKSKLNTQETLEKVNDSVANLKNYLNVHDAKTSNF
jgi:hypothetical protein